MRASNLFFNQRIHSFSIISLCGLVQPMLDCVSNQACHSYLKIKMRVEGTIFQDIGFSLDYKMRRLTTKNVLHLLYSLLMLNKKRWVFAVCLLLRGIHKCTAHRLTTVTHPLRTPATLSLFLQECYPTPGRQEPR